MPLQVAPATESDAPRIVEIENMAYEDDVLTPILFPGPFPEGASAKRAEEMVQQLRMDPTSRWLKVIDTDTGKMIAFAKWNVYEPGAPRPKVPERSYGEGCNEPACRQFWGVMDEKRQHHMGKIPHVWLDLLQTDPNHQGRGAGGILVKWGVELADQMRINAYLESSPMAHRLYAKRGFKDIDEMVFDMTPWGGSGTHTTTYMLRPIPQ